MNDNAWMAPLRGVLFAALFLIGLPSMAQTLSMRAATETAKGEDTALLIEYFKESLEHLSNGSVKVSDFYGGTLGTQRQLQEQVQLGTIEMVSTGSDMTEVNPKYSIFDLPFLLKDRSHAFRVLDGDVGKSLAESTLATKGVRVLAYGELGFRQITNRVRPILTPKDLQGLKIRVPSNKPRLAAFKALGAAATPIPYKELYTSLQQGVVDGQENPLYSISALSLWDIQKYVSLTNHVFTPAYLLVNERWYQALSPANRDLVTRAAAEAQTKQRSTLASGDAAIIAKLKQHGMRVDTPDPEPFVKATQVVWAEFGDPELIKKISALR
jgi:tripartite ATP-independent transporter DctP family solute receptor